jgi:hypothetical protein
MSELTKPVCAISAPIFSRSGYGGLATDIAKSIIRYGKWDVVIYPTRWGGCPSKTLEEQVTSDEDKVLLSKFAKSPMAKQPDVFLQVSIPNECNPIGKYNIVVTAGIETTCPSPAFIEGVNKSNLTIVTSNFVKDVFTAANFTKQYPDGKTEVLKTLKPIEVCFWGIDTNTFKKTSETYPSVESLMKKIPTDFNFFFCGQWTNHSTNGSDRKDIGNLIKTFLTTFKDKDVQPGLILKTSGVNFSIVDRTETLRKIKQVQDSVDGKLPPIYLIHGELTSEEMNGILNHPKVKCCVSATHGEGFGMPLLEATLSGKPLLAPKWSGHLDFLNPEHANFLEGDVKQISPESANDWLIKESGWFYVNHSLMAEKMKNIFHHYSDKWTTKAEALRIENMEKFSLQKMDERLWSILDTYVPEFTVEKKIVLPKLKKLELPKVAQA